jgi:hypothetical protein
VQLWYKVRVTQGTENMDLWKNTRLSTNKPVPVIENKGSTTGITMITN